MTEKELEIKPLFDAAVAARKEADYELARQLCEQALGLLDRSDRRPISVVHFELGNIHSELDDPDTAASHYERSVEASPKSELASLGLFHALVEQGEWKLALTEVVRFLTLKDSTEYRELLSGDGFRDDLPADARSLAQQARNILG